MEAVYNREKFKGMLEASMTSSVKAEEFLRYLRHCLKEAKYHRDQTQIMYQNLKTSKKQCMSRIRVLREKERELKQKQEATERRMKKKLEMDQLLNKKGVSNEVK